MKGNQQSSIDSNTSCQEIKYKQCGGTGCNNIATHILVIALINRIGYFCEKCKFDLEKNGLIKFELSQNQFNLLCEKDN